MIRSPHEPLVSLSEAVALDPRVPIRVRHAVGPLTVAIVSVAWLRGHEEVDLTRLASRHLASDRAQFDELRFRKRRLEWLAGRIAVKRSVAAFLERYDARVVDPTSVVVEHVHTGASAGRPFVRGGPAIALTHSGDFAISVAAPRAVGVDLERVSSMTESHVAYALTPGEHERARARDMPLVLRWACKEAILKLFGVGLRLGMQVLDVDGWKDDGRFAWSTGKALDDAVRCPTNARLHGSWAAMVTGYALALAWR